MIKFIEEKKIRQHMKYNYKNFYAVLSNTLATQSKSNSYNHHLLLNITTLSQLRHLLSEIF